MTDPGKLVETLRSMARSKGVGYITPELLTRVADEIQRLQRELENAVEQIRLSAMTPEEVDVWLDERAAP